jgi:hypothetical protein
MPPVLSEPPPDWMVRFHPPPPPFASENVTRISVEVPSSMQVPDTDVNAGAEGVAPPPWQPLQSTFGMP